MPPREMRYNLTLVCNVCVQQTSDQEQAMDILPSTQLAVITVRKLSKPTRITMSVVSGATTNSYQFQNMRAE